MNGSSRRGVWLPLLLCAVLGCGCATGGPAVAPAPPIPPFRGAGEEPGAASAVPAVGSFLQSDRAMRAWVQAELGQVADPRARLRRLGALLLDPSDRGIVYDPDVTLSAAGLFERRRGNCLSFAALFVVLAREAGLDAWFQDVPVLPNWRLDGDAFVVERHVNAVVRAGGDEYVIDFRPPASMATTRTRRITDRNATAQYFGNLGVERFSAGDLAGAYALLRRGLEADPGAASLWVNLGVVLGRNGQADAAVAAYEQALVLEKGNLSALSNLAGVEAARGNAQRAESLRDRVAAYRAANPYYQYWIGEGRLRAGDARGALRAWRDAVRLMPEEADFRFALARASLELGLSGEAARHLDEALARAPNDGVRLRYRQRFAKLTGSAAVAPQGRDPGREER